MDEEAARLDMEKLQDLLESTAGKSKKQKGKTEEQCITFENLNQYPYVMQQSAWELDWDKVQALYCPHIGIPMFIINNSIIAQWSSTVSPSSPQQLTDSEDSNTLYAHVVLFSLTPLNLLNAVEGREQGNFGEDPALFVYSAVVVFVHPGQVLTTIQNTIGFFQHQYDTICRVVTLPVGALFANCLTMRRHGTSPWSHTCHVWRCPCLNHLEIQLSDPSFA